MRTHAKENASPAVSEGVASKPSENDGKGNWFRLHWRLLSLFVIVIVAFLFRFVFAYGISAGDNYALSGGSSASSHLRVITEILAGTYDPANEISLNYPLGIASISGPLYDFVMAAFAWLVTLFGVSDATAAAGTMAWSAPILGALTCIPVFMVAKKLFKDDVIALVSALFYALFPALIMTSVFSNGTEYPLLCFLMAWFVYFVASAYSKADELNATGFKSVLKVSPIRAYTLVAAGFFALIVLTWTSFWAAVMAISIMMLVAALIQRVGGKDLGVLLGVPIVIFIVGVIVGAVYYIPTGLWESVYQGGCLLAVLAVVYALIFLALEKKPWVLSIPVTAIIMVAVAVVLAIAVPDISRDILSGSVAVTGDLARALADQMSRTSISTMAAYYGWLTVWFPLFCGVWMAYKYRSHSRSLAYLFTMLWLFACFFAGWFATEYAVVAGAGFAVGSAYLVVSVLREVDMKSYFRSLRGNGFKAGAKKALNFFPLVSLLVAVLLIALPTAVYAVDASTPTNDEHVDYFGGLSYTVNTSDSTLTNSAWNYYGSEAKDGALISWYGYSDAASQYGGFSTVTSSNGGGAAAMASTYLSTGSSGALASMIVRLVGDDAAKYTSEFTEAGVSGLVKIVDDENEARKYISDNSDDFVQYNTSLSSDTVSYLAGVHYLTCELNGAELSDLYDKLCSKSGNKIGYIEVDSSMIPIYANDGTYATTLAYFNDYALDSNGCPSELFNITSTTEMYYKYGYYAQLYYTYQDAMYETFLWNALIGVTPSQFDLSNSLELLSKLSESDGTVKAQPGTGIDNFSIDYWHVMYKATEDGEWTDMDAKEAIKKQNADGGYINYLSSVVVYKYDNTQNVKSGTVTAGTTDNPVSGVKVAVYELVDYDSKSSVSYIQRSTAYTDAEGKFSILVPASGDYLVKYFVGSDSLRGGVCVATDSDTSKTDYSALLDSVNASGKLVDSDNNVFSDSNATISFVGSDGEITSVVVGSNGEYSVTLTPDEYTINVYGSDGSLLNTVSSVTLIGTMDHLDIDIGAAKATVTVNDLFGREMDSAVEVTFAGTNGVTFTREITGSQEIYVPVGDYTVFVKSADYVSVQAKSMSVEDSSSSSVTATLSVYDATSVPTAEGSVLAALGYSTVAVGTTAYIPVVLDELLTEYAGKGVEVSGVLQNSSGNAVAGTVAFIGSNGKVYVFAADSEGKFSGYVASSDVDYTVYATNESQAYFSKITAGSALTDLTVKMDTAYYASAAVKYSTNMKTSTVGLAFTPITFTVKIGEDTYTIPAVTGSDGSYKLYVPKDAEVSYSVAESALVAYNEIFDLISVEGSTGLVYQSGTKTITSGTSLGTFTIAAYDSKGESSSVKTIPKGDLELVTDDGEFTGTLVFDANAGSTYDLYLTVKNGVITGINKYTIDTKAVGDAIDYIIPGLYKVTVFDKSSQYIDSQEVNIYPDYRKTVSDPKQIELETVDCFKVTVTKTTDTDTVSVVKIENGEEEGDYLQDGNDYYFQTGYRYYFKVTDSDGKLAYSTVFVDEGTFSGYTLVESKTLKGYVGSAVNGYLYLTSGDMIIQAEVSKGEYSVELPARFSVNHENVKLIAEVTEGDYTYTANTDLALFTAFTVDEDKTFNFASATGKALADETVTVDFAVLNNGRAKIKLTIENTNDYDVTYYVSADGALTLDKVYTIDIKAGETIVTDVLDGYYNVKTIGAGNSDMTLEVKTVDGTSVGKVVVNKDCTADETGNVTVEFSDAEGVSDAADGYSYKYAMKFTNTDSKFKSVTIDLASVPEGWYAMLTDSSGLYIQKLGSACQLNGLGDTTWYVMLINMEGSSTTEVPSISVKITDAVDKTQDLKAMNAELSSTDHSVTGDGADNSEKSLSTGFWILTVVTVLLLLIAIWGGMKRGVFSRKN